MLSVVVKNDKVQTQAVRQRQLGLVHNTLSIYGDFIFLNKK
jgi:hypothetical protein